MTNGPCLCGDIYCPSCGSPGQASFSDACDTLIDQITAADLNEQEFALFKLAGFMFIKMYRNETEGN